jgi:hypothetical protein
MAGHGAQQQTKFGRLLELFDRVDGRVEVRAGDDRVVVGEQYRIVLAGDPRTALALATPGRK